MSVARRFRVSAVGALFLAVGAGPVLAQALPPPVVRKSPSPQPRRERGERDKEKEKGSGGGPAAPAPLGPATLLLKSDLACTVSVDGEKRETLPANGIKRITVTPGKHLLSAQSPDGRLTWEGVVEGKPGQQEVVQIKLAAVAEVATNDDFDRAAGRAWLAFSDLVATGVYAKAVLEKSWGFHDQRLSTAVHTVHQQVQVAVQDVKRNTPRDAERRRILDEVTRFGEAATRYVELLTKAVTSAQRANSWMGEPNDLYAQARAMLPTIAWSPSSLGVLKTSAAFAEAVGPQGRAELQIGAEAGDFRLGAHLYHGNPGLVAAVDKGSVADSLGLKAGDRVVSVAGEPVQSAWGLKMALRQAAGKKVELVVERGGDQQKKDVRVPSQLR